MSGRDEGEGGGTLVGAGEDAGTNDGEGVTTEDGMDEVVEEDTTAGTIFIFSLPASDDTDESCIKQSSTSLSRGAASNITLGLETNG